MCPNQAIRNPASETTVGIANPRPAPAGSSSRSSSSASATGRSRRSYSAMPATCPPVGGRGDAAVRLSATKLVRRLRSAKVLLTPAHDTRTSSHHDQDHHGPARSPSRISISLALTAAYAMRARARYKAHEARVPDTHTVQYVFIYRSMNSWIYFPGTVFEIPTDTTM